MTTADEVLASVRMRGDPVHAVPLGASVAPAGRAGLAGSGSGTVRVACAGARVPVIVTEGRG